MMTTMAEAMMAEAMMAEAMMAEAMMAEAEFIFVLSRGDFAMC